MRNALFIPALPCSFIPAIMETYLLGILNANPVASGFVVFCFLIGVALKVATGVINFHEEFSVQRYLKRLRSLTDDTDKDSLTYQYVKALRENEVFRIASGIESYPEKTDMLIQIYLRGVASKRELKRLSSYLFPKNEQISIAVHCVDKFSFAYSWFCIWLFVSLAVYIILWNYIIGTWVHVFAAIICAFILIATGMFLGRDYKTWRILKRARERLIELNMVANPDDSIEWNTLR